MSKQYVLGYSADAFLPPEIELVRSILRTSSLTEGKWVVGKRGPCNAMLLKDDSTNLHPFTKTANTSLIYVRRRGESKDGFVFFKPFRADELIKILVQIQTGVEAVNAHDVKWIDLLPSASFKLKKWPNSDLLSRDKNYTRLATYLIRSFKSVKDLARLSGTDVDACNKFLTDLDEYKLLLVDSNQQEPNVPTLGKPAKTGRGGTEVQGNFISNLRKRFGLLKRA